MDIEHLKNGHETFVCNRCTFNSNDVKMIKEHLSNHIQNNHQSVQEIETPQSNETNVKPANTDNEESKETKNDNKAKKYEWSDDFGDFGN